MQSVGPAFTSGSPRKSAKGVVDLEESGMFGPGDVPEDVGGVRSQDAFLSSPSLQKHPSLMRRSSSDSFLSVLVVAQAQHRRQPVRRRQGHVRLLAEVSGRDLPRCFAFIDYPGVSRLSVLGMGAS